MAVVVNFLIGEFLGRRIFKISHHALTSTVIRSKFIKGSSATPEVGSGVVVKVNPGIGGELAALDDGASFVCGARLLQLWVPIQRTGPQQGATFDGLDCDSQLGKCGLASLFHVGEIEKEGEDARPTGQASLLRSVVVVSNVFLAHLVAQDLCIPDGGRTKAAEECER